MVSLLTVLVVPAAVEGFLLMMVRPSPSFLETSR